MSEAFKDELINQMCRRHVTRRLSVRGEISLTLLLKLSHLLWFLISSWSAGRQFFSSWDDGAQRSLAGQTQREGLCLLLSGVLIEKRSVPFRWTFQGESF